jgi:hypothetical protein
LDLSVIAGDAMIAARPGPTQANAIIQTNTAIQATPRRCTQLVRNTGRTENAKKRLLGDFAQFARDRLFGT